LLELPLKQFSCGIRDAWDPMDFSDSWDFHLKEFFAASRMLAGSLTFEGLEDFHLNKFPAASELLKTPRILAILVVPI
jgi:hypothetical protein